MKRLILHLIFILSFTCSFALDAPQDSVGVAFKDGKYFIIHSVNRGQGLYAISKVYRVTITDITDANPGMAPAVQEGQLLYIPTTANYSGAVLSSINANGQLMQGNEEKAPKKATPTEEKPKEKAPEPEKKKEKPSEKKETPPATKDNKFDWSSHNAEEDLYHTVKLGETLYRIATFYGVAVQEIKSLNDMPDNVIEEGQQLLVYKGKKQAAKRAEAPKEKEPEKKTEPQPEKQPEKKAEITPKKDEKKEDVQPEKKAEKQPEKKSTEQPQNTKKYTYDYNKQTGEVTEGGMALVISNDFADADKNVALHVTAEVGTIIMLTNEKNGKTVFVRVIGKLESMDPEVIIMISPESAKRLDLKMEGKSKLKLSYSKN